MRKHTSVSTQFIEASDLALGVRLRGASQEHSVNQDKYILFPVLLSLHSGRIQCLQKDRAPLQKLFPPGSPQSLLMKESPC